MKNLIHIFFVIAVLASCGKTHQVTNEPLQMSHAHCFAAMHSIDKSKSTNIDVLTLVCVDGAVACEVLRNDMVVTVMHGDMVGYCSQ